MENKSQVLLKAGDRVLTSKGNIGEVVTLNHLVGHSDNNMWCFLESSYNKEIIPVLIEKWEKLMPENNIFFKTVVTVQLGNKSHVIALNQLTKLDTLFPVRVIWTDDTTGMSQDNETVVYLPKDFCLFCNGDKPGGNNLYSRIIPFLQSQVGIRDYISIFKIYAL